MNQELKQLILDICRQYPVHNHGVALTITGGRFRITLDKQYPVRPQMQIMVAMQIVYRTYFNIDGDTALDRDATEIYRAMQSKLRQQERDEMAKDTSSLRAISELRAAVQYDRKQNKGR